MAEEPQTDAQKPALSRRDFLRRAGREAAETGAQLMPGARIAAAAVKTPWWQKIARWRQGRAEDTATDSTPSPEETNTEHEQTHP